MKTLGECYKNKKIVVTGHTGFKGSWLSLWLYELGAEVIGISKEIIHPNGLYRYLNEGKIFKSEYFSDIVNISEIERILVDSKPDYLFHLAAQPIVSISYSNPSLTFYTNTIGTMNILESLKSFKNNIKLILITSDKCYENVETFYGYKEIDKLGGKDPYSASKACAEIIANCYARSIYKKLDNIKIATARAGNVIGGGDWSLDRLIPDAVRAWKNKNSLVIRNPKSTRPWQHVLEPLRGYLMLGNHLNQFELDVENFSGSSFNFGPRTDDVIEVEKVIKKFSIYWKNAKYEIDLNSANFEAGLLNLSYDKAANILNWTPKLNATKSIELTAKWYLAQEENKQMLDFSINQIKEYETL
tara:strand:+ start:552 stop:1625 length:1074 start_codon:yes stop_codon:yes gene_type:complete